MNIQNAQDCINALEFKAEQLAQLPQEEKTELLESIHLLLQETIDYLHQEIDAQRYYMMK